MSTPKAVIGLLCLLSATSAAAHPQPEPQPQPDGVQIVHKHNPRDPRLLPYHAYPQVDIEADSPPDVADGSSSIPTVTASSAASTPISVPASHPTSPSPASAADTPPPAPMDANNEPSWGTKLLHPLRIYWDGEDSDSSPSSAAANKDTSSSSQGGHWPDYDPTATSMDSNDETDPGEGGDAHDMSSMDKGSPPSSSLEDQHEPHAIGKRSLRFRLHSTSHSQPHSQSGSDRLMKPKFKTHPLPHSLLEAAGPLLEHEPTNGNTNANGIAAQLVDADDIFSPAVAYSKAPASGSDGSPPPVTEYRHQRQQGAAAARAGGEISDWIKLQREFALQQRWRRCTRFGEGVCPEKPKM